MSDRRSRENGKTHSRVHQRGQRGHFPRSLTDMGDNSGIAKHTEDQVVESGGMGSFIHHEVLARHFAQTYALSFRELMAGGDPQKKKIAVHPDEPQFSKTPPPATQKNKKKRTRPHTTQFIPCEGI